MATTKMSLAAASLTVAAALSFTGCTSSTPPQSGEVPADGAPQQSSSKWDTFDTAFASWMELYSNREFTEICTHVSNVGMAELVPGYGSSCEKALEYKQGQPLVRYISDPEYADWTISDGNIADEETMRAAGEVHVSTADGQESADIFQYDWWVTFANGWKDGTRAVFAYDPTDGWVIVNVG